MTAKPNRQEVPSLLVIATPLGNLGDLSPRARDALSSVGLVCAEDTRVARQLYAALEINAPELLALDAHRAQGRNLTISIEKIKSFIARGESVALVTDAGTPAVSDPGATVVRAARDEGIRVTCVPGPSALTAALSMCGLEAERVLWNGFFSRRPKDEIERLQNETLSGLHVWFESPERVVTTVNALAQTFPDVEGWVGKELTKFHEREFHGTLRDLADQLSLLTPAERKGEWVLALRFAFEPKKKLENFDSALTCLAIAKVPLSQAVAITQKQFDARHRDVYEAALTIYKKDGSRG